MSHAVQKQVFIARIESLDGHSRDNKEGFSISVRLEEFSFCIIPRTNVKITRGSAVRRMNTCRLDTCCETRRLFEVGAQGSPADLLCEVLSSASPVVDVV